MPKFESIASSFEDGIQSLDTMLLFQKDLISFAGFALSELVGSILQIVASPKLRNLVVCSFQPVVFGPEN